LDLSGVKVANGVRQYVAVRLDHLSYAAGPEGLASTVQRLGAALGAGFVDGGLHPRFGTRNFVLPLAGATYLEVVGHLDHPATDKEPFGQAVKQRSEAGGGWLAWVVAVDDLEGVEGRLGRNAVEGNRQRPDGYELRWRQIGIRGLLDDPQLPFFIQWLSDAEHHPSSGADGSVGINRMEISGDADKVADWLGQPSTHPLGNVDVSWVDGDEAGLVAVEFTTPRGTVRID
jgi:hypothetical protein